MRSTSYRSAVSLSALFALLVCVCVPASHAQTAPNAQTDAPAPTASVQLAPLPNTAQFSQKVDFRTRPAGESLDALVQILARSVGLSAITQGIPEDTVVRYDLGEPKPFREVWDIVLTLNGLEYVLRDNGIVVVGPPEALAGLRPLRDNGQARIKVTYQVNSVPDRLKTLLQNQFPTGNDVTIDAFNGLGLISVQGTPVQQMRVRAILDRFDQTAVRRIYNLSYAKADALATVLVGTLNLNNQGEFSEELSVPDLCNPEQVTTVETSVDNTTGDEVNGGETNQGEEEADQPIVSVLADRRTNSLVVTAPARIQEEVVRLLEELDQPQRQVNVQVRIQEVSTDISERLGINLTAALGNFATTLFGTDDTDGLSFIFDAQRAISGFNIGAVLDAYERQGLSRRVDDSNLTVLNNGLASLRSGGKITITLPTSGETPIQRTIDYGVFIGLSPQITNSQEVILDVCALVQTPLSDINDPNLQNFSARRVGSLVTLQPGQTVVLGGLVQNQLTEATGKVPGLGDIPVVGSLFATNSATETSTELLVIVTANVLE